MKLIAILITAAAISACSPSEEQEKTDLLKGQRAALEKAKQVEGVLQEADEKRRQQLELDQ
jgi:hypothetical protein